MTNEIAVLIPCYNEGLTIRKVVEDFKKYLDGSNYKIYVYDNNSSDNTVSEAKEAGAIVRHEYKQGKGNVIRRMFREIEADCYIMTDGDDTYDASNCMEMVKLVLEKNADMVIGDRLTGGYFEENKRPFHNMGNTLVRKSINKIFKSDITDVMTGYRAFSRNFVKTFPVLSRGFEVETEMTIHAIDKGMQLESITVNYKDRIEGSVSKLNTIPDGIKVLKTIKNMFMTYKPFTFFTVIAAFLSLISTGFLIPVIAEYAHTGEVEKFPTLIVCMAVYMLAMLIFIAGIILQNLRRKELTDFEYTLNNVSWQGKNPSIDAIPMNLLKHGEKIVIRKKDKTA